MISHQLISVILIIACSVSPKGTGVSDYRTYFAECKQAGSARPVLALRRFTKDGDDFVLTVDPETLRTSVQAMRSLGCSPVSLEAIRVRYRDSAYVKALAESEKNSDRIQNAGFTHFLPSEKGVNLTADLCPSKLPFDRVLITSVIDEFGKIESPVPIGLSVTGVWMEEHPDDLAWIVGLERSGLVSVTWINHSYNHRFSRKLPLRKNFLLEKGTDLDYEVLATEKKMLESGLVPSVFFRFPGLVSDLEIFERIARYGLIPLGSDAWLAKKQWPKQGSIVLVHGNGHEPIGIRDFLALLKAENKAILNKHWFLYDLRESVEEYENDR